MSHPAARAAVKSRVRRVVLALPGALKDDGTMFKRSHAHAVETLAALDKSLATIKFDTSGKILAANANFCAAMGYALDEIVGQHHRMFVDADAARSAEAAMVEEANAASARLRQESDELSDLVNRFMTSATPRVQPPPCLCAAPGLASRTRADQPAQLQ